jgi:hypothetical protein
MYCRWGYIIARLLECHDVSTGKTTITLEGEATIMSPNAQQRTPSDLMQYPRQVEFQQFFTYNKKKSVIY